jgi:hypothetical protein
VHERLHLVGVAADEPADVESDSHHDQFSR